MPLGWQSSNFTKTSVRDNLKEVFEYFRVKPRRGARFFRLGTLMCLRWMFFAHTPNEVSASFIGQFVKWIGQFQDGVAVATLSLVPLLLICLVPWWRRVYRHHFYWHYENCVLPLEYYSNSHYYLKNEGDRPDADKLRRVRNLLRNNLEYKWQPEHGSADEITAERLARRGWLRKHPMGGYVIGSEMIPAGDDNLEPRSVFDDSMAP